MLRKLTAAVAMRPAVAVVVVAATLVVTATLAGDLATVVDAPATLGVSENGTLVEPTDGGGWGGPHDVGGGGS